ncbi:MAG: hypothetical protein U0802_00860 [Candidatus Binatia bacterium]
MRGHAVAGAALNLAAPEGSRPLVRHLRGSSGMPRMPLIAYALADKAAKGFWLGPVDFAACRSASSTCPSCSTAWCRRSSACWR